MTAAATITITRQIAIGERMNQQTRSLGWCVVSLNERPSDHQLTATITVEPFYTTETVGSAWSGYQKKVVDFRVVGVATDLDWPWAEKSIVEPAMRQWATYDAGYAALYAAFKGSEAEATMKAAEDAEAKTAEEEAARVLAETKTAEAVLQAEFDDEMSSFMPYYEAMKAVAIPQAEAEAIGSYVRCGYRNNEVAGLWFRTIADADSIKEPCSAIRVGQVFVNGRRVAMF